MRSVEQGFSWIHDRSIWLNTLFIFPQNCQSYFVDLGIVIPHDSALSIFIWHMWAHVWLVKKKWFITSLRFMIYVFS